MYVGKLELLVFTLNCRFFAKIQSCIVLLRSALLPPKGRSAAARAHASGAERSISELKLRTSFFQEELANSLRIC